MTTIDLDRMSHLPELFERLRSGRHLCADDGALYLSLRSDFASHRALFDALGFDLVEHDRGFYYFRSGEDLGKEATQLAVFFFVLVEAWGDSGKDIEATAFAAAGHAMADFPHLTRHSWRQCMAEANVTTEEELSSLVRKLDRFGFTERIGDDRVRFRTPTWRLFDLCLDVLALDDEATASSSSPEPE